MVAECNPGSIYWVISPKELLRYDENNIHGVTRPFLCVGNLKDCCYMMPLSTSRVEKNNNYVLYSNKYKEINGNTSIEITNIFKIEKDKIISFLMRLNEEDYRKIIKKILVMYIMDKSYYDESFIKHLYTLYTKDLKYDVGQIFSCEIDSKTNGNYVLVDYDEEDLYLIKMNKNKTSVFTKRFYINKEQSFADISGIVKVPKSSYHVLRNVKVDKHEVEKLKESINNNVDCYTIGDIILINDMEYVFFGLINNKYFVVDKKHAKEFPMVERFDINNYQIVGKIPKNEVIDLYSKIRNVYEMDQEIRKKLSLIYTKYRKQEN